MCVGWVLVASSSFSFFSEESCGTQFKMWGRRRKEKEAATGTTSNPGAHSASSPEAAANTRSVTPQSQPRGGGTVSECVNYGGPHTHAVRHHAGVVRVSNSRWHLEECHIPRTPALAHA